MSRRTTPLWRFLLVLALCAFALNWLWEMLQMPGYAEMAGLSWRVTAARCTTATLGDVVITLGIYGIGATAAGQWHWGLVGGWNVLATGAMLGALIAVAVEHVALAHGRWSYTDRMPIVPVLAVGLWPFLQLTVLVPLALALARWSSHR